MLLTNQSFTGETQFLAADTTTKKTLVSNNGTNHKRVYGITGYCSDVTARPIMFYLSDGITDFLVWTSNIPANSGAATNVGLTDLLDANSTSVIYHHYDANYNLYFDLPIGWSLKGSLVSSVSSPYNVTITTKGEIYS